MDDSKKLSFTQLKRHFGLMSALVTYPHIVKEEGKPARLESHPRTRVSMIATDHISRGWSAEEIVRQYPYLTHSEVYSALAYYHDHAEEIDLERSAELAEYEKWRERTPRTPLEKRLSALLAKDDSKKENGS